MTIDIEKGPYIPRGVLPYSAIRTLCPLTVTGRHPDTNNPQQLGIVPIHRSHDQTVVFQVNRSATIIPLEQGHHPLEVEVLENGLLIIGGSNFPVKLGYELMPINRDGIWYGIGTDQIFESVDSSGRHRIFAFPNATEAVQADQQISDFQHSSDPSDFLRRLTSARGF